MKARSKLTEEQRKNLAPVLDQLEKGIDDLTRKLTAMGVVSDEGPFAACLAHKPDGSRCGCEGFVAPAHGVPWKCARPNCGHSFTRHDVQ